MTSGVLVAVSVVLFALFSAQAAAKQRVTVYCDEDYPPYSYEQEGRAAGLYVDILTRIFARMQNYIVEVQPVPWPRGVTYLETGEGFALFPPYKRAERTFMEYSEPILDERYSLFVLDTPNARTINKWPDDALGMVIGKNIGYYISEDQSYLHELGAGRLQVVEAPSTEMNLLKLFSGRIEGFVNPPLFTRNEWERLKAANKVTGDIREVLVLSEEKGYLAVTTRKPERYPYRAAFLREFNKHLQAMQARGELQYMVQHFEYRQ